MILKCKICGGTLDIQKGELLATCEYCGTKQTIPHTSNEAQMDQFNRINELRQKNEYDKALRLCEQTIFADEKDAESYWNAVLCRYGIEYVEDPISHKHIPTINRMQYSSVLNDADYLMALQLADAQQRSIYEAQAKDIYDIQKGTLDIIKKEKPFDVFICYKETDESGKRTPDSVLANDLYHQLTEEGFKVFFARITLEDKLGSAYEPYIFAALNSAKVMVVLGTKPDYFNAVWVKNEWSRFLALARSNPKKVLIPAYRDMDAYDLPGEFAHLQAQDMAKLGFMPDLIRGIKKILAGNAKNKLLIPLIGGVAAVALVIGSILLFGGKHKLPVAGDDPASSTTTTSQSNTTETGETSSQTTDQSTTTEASQTSSQTTGQSTEGKSSSTKKTTTSTSKKTSSATTTSSSGGLVQVGPAKPQIINVYIEEHSYRLLVGAQEKWAYELNYDYYSADNPRTDNVLWESSNPSVATVDSNGNITAISGGVTTITVTTSNGISSDVYIEVYSFQMPTLPVTAETDIFGVKTTYTVSKLELSCDGQDIDVEAQGEALSCDSESKEGDVWFYLNFLDSDGFKVHDSLVMVDVREGDKFKEKIKQLDYFLEKAGAYTVEIVPYINN